MAFLVKICGLKTPETLDTVIEAGADMAGFVFFPPSPRNLEYEVARRLGERAKGRVLKVALTVDADDAAFESIVESLRPDMLQLHGRETPARIMELKRRFGLPVMKAIAVEEKEDLIPVAIYTRVADRILFDARPPREATRPGGLGKAFDWHLLISRWKFRKATSNRIAGWGGYDVPKQSSGNGGWGGDAESLRHAWFSLRDALAPGTPFMLSGGLDTGNVAEALAITRAGGVDVSSGVERAPGEKDSDKIRTFIKAARQAQARIENVKVASNA